MAKLDDSRGGFFRSLRLLILSGVLLGGPAYAQAPVFVEIRAEADSVPFGSDLELEIVLLDENNQPAVALKEYRVELVMRPNREEAVPLGRVLIPANVSSVNVLLQVSEVGAISMSSLEAIPSEEPVEVDKAGVVSFLVLHPELFQRELFLFIGAPGESHHEAPLGFLDLMWVVASNPTSTVAEPLGFRLYYTDVPLLAGSEKAEIHLVLVDAEGEAVPAPEDITIGLHASIGELEPREIHIPEGDFRGKATLSSNQAGEATITRIFSRPRGILLRDAAELQPIVFSPVRWKASVSSASISLLQPSEITVMQLAQDDDRTITFTINQGHGIVRPVEFVMHGNELTRQAKFIPIWTGNVTVLASSDGRDELLSITVTWELALLWLLFSLLGGFAGSWAAVFANKNKREDRLWARKRKIVGMLTGFILYWALIFGVVPLGSLTVAGIVLNPFSAFVLSALGGWIGADVFNLILQRINIARPAGA